MMKYLTLLLLFLSQASTAADTYYWHGNCAADPSDFNLACNWTENQNGTGAHPPDAASDDFTSDVLNGWTFLNTNSDPGWGEYSLTDNADKLTLRNRGADVWGADNEFSSIVRDDIDGNFEVSVYVESQTNTHDWAKAGIMAANNISNLSAGGYLILAVTPNRGVALQWDGNGDGELDANANTGSVSKPVWLKLVKSGTQFSGYYKINHNDAWTQVGSMVSPGGTGADSEIGLFMSAHTNSSQGTVVMDDFQGGGRFDMAGLDLYFNGYGTGADNNCNMTADATLNTINWEGYGGTFNHNGKAMYITGDAIGGEHCQMTGLSSAKMEFIASSGVQTMVPWPNKEMTHIVHSGAGTLQLQGFPLTAMSFTQTAGSLDFNFNNVYIRSGGDFSIQNGTSSTISDLSGVFIQAAGDISFNGQPGNLLNLNPGASWSVEATNTLTADYATLGNCNANIIPGTAMHSADSGGNNNWVFKWGYDMAIRINTSESGADIEQDVENFPLLVRLHELLFDFTHASENGGDIRFESMEGVSLSYEIEEWDKTAGKASVWVLVPLVKSDEADQYIIMRWGGPDVDSESKGEDVFKTSNNFTAVYHLKDGEDATANNYDGLKKNDPTKIQGAIGPAHEFDDNDWFEIPEGNTMNYTSTVTLSAWIKPESKSGWKNVFARQYGGSSADSWQIGITGNNAFMGPKYDHKSGTVDYGNWYHLVAVKNGDTEKIYINGSKIKETTGRPNFNTDDNEVTIGCQYNRSSGDANECFKGIIDEVRASDIERSMHWIKLSYETQKPGQTAVDANLNAMLHRLAEEYEGNLLKIPAPPGPYNDGYIEVKGIVDLVKSPRP